MTEITFSALRQKESWGTKIWFSDRKIKLQFSARWSTWLENSYSRDTQLLDSKIIKRVAAGNSGPGPRAPVPLGSSYRIGADSLKLPPQNMGGGNGGQDGGLCAPYPARVLDLSELLSPFQSPIGADSRPQVQSLKMHSLSSTRSYWDIYKTFHGPHKAINLKIHLLQIDWIPSSACGCLGRA